MFSKNVMNIIKHDAEDSNLVKTAQTAAGRKAAAQGRMDALKSISSK